MNQIELKNFLNTSFGSPGDTARTLTKEYEKQRRNFSKGESCRKTLLIRQKSYEFNGFKVIDDALFERILKKADSEFAFVIFADVFASNNCEMQQNVGAVIENFDLIIEIIIENYNSLVGIIDQTKNVEALKFKAKQFINEELQDDIFEIKKDNIIDKIWNTAKVSHERDSNLWRKDGFGAWINKSEYNKTTKFGWTIITNTIHGTQIPFHWQNTERDKDGNIKCKLKSSGLDNIDNKGCYIATVCYGDIDAIEVQIFRDYRDKVLTNTFGGRLFISIYYSISPSIAKVMKKAPFFNKLIQKCLLNPMLDRIMNSKK